MDLNKLMKQAQEMQASLGKAQDELDASQYVGENGGEEGVKVTIDGTCRLQSVEIADELMTLENKEMLQDMLLLAMNQAVDKASNEREEKMGNLTQGMNIPGLK